MGRSRQALSRRGRRRGGERAGPCPPQTGEGDCRSGRDADPFVQPVSRAAAGRTGRPPVRICRAWTRRFFCNSGCEANEAAIKLARLYGHGKGIEVPTIIVMEKAFHGRTMATLTATGSRKIQAGFEPLLSGFARVPFNDLDAIRHVAEHNKSVVAVLVEVVQGEGGINILPSEFLVELRADLRCPRLAADAGRSADRHRPHRHLVRLPAFGRDAGRDGAGQGPGLGHADRRLSRARRGGRRFPAGQPWFDLRRQSAGVRGRAGDAGCDRGREAAGQRARARRGDPQRLAAGAGRRALAWSTFAARA